ncbi:GatB/GatE catalytic domain-containing protein, partial [Terfezia claveryi]
MEWNLRARGQVGGRLWTGDPCAVEYGEEAIFWFGVLEGWDAKFACRAIDAALPGSQPIFQPQTLLPALRAAIALNCEIMPESRFDRKHYFYWDQPGGYQITQFYHPLAKNGYIKLFPTDGIDLGEGVGEMVVGIKQVQMEQDTAKTITTPSLDPMTTPSTHLIDLNRVSHLLIEVITTPCLPSSTHASLALRKLQSLLRVSSAAVVGMEWGGLRCDANVSVSPRGSTTLGQRCEIKNLFSIKVVEEAVEAEARRQVSVLENGGVVAGETRGWDGDCGGNEGTFRLRGKEGEVDYRYMPEPDVPPVKVGGGVVEWLRMEIPELPDYILGRLAREVKAGGEYGLTLKDANTLMAWDGGARVGYFEEVVAKVRRHLEE